MANIKIESFTQPITQDVLQNKDFSFVNGGNSSVIEFPQETSEAIDTIKEAVTKTMGTAPNTAPILEAVFYTLSDIKNISNQNLNFLSNIYNLLVTTNNLLLQIKNNTDRI